MTRGETWLRCIMFLIICSRSGPPKLPTSSIMVSIVSWCSIIPVHTMTLIWVDVLYGSPCSDSQYFVFSSLFSQSPLPVHEICGGSNWPVGEIPLSSIMGMARRSSHFTTQWLWKPWSLSSHFSSSSLPSSKQLKHRSWSCGSTGKGGVISSGVPDKYSTIVSYMSVVVL